LTLESGCGRETDCLLEGSGFELPVPCAVQTSLRRQSPASAASHRRPIIRSCCRRTSPKAGQSERRQRCHSEPDGRLACRARPDECRRGHYAARHRLGDWSWPAPLSVERQVPRNGLTKVPECPEKGNAPSCRSLFAISWAGIELDYIDRWRRRGPPTSGRLQRINTSESNWSSRRTNSHLRALAACRCGPQEMYETNDVG
jgi:hypothetical protein